MSRALFVAVPLIGFAFALAFFERYSGATHSAQATSAPKASNAAAVYDDSTSRKRGAESIQVKDGTSEIVLPAKLPGAAKDVVVSNPGVLVAVSRFYRLLQSSDLKAKDVVCPPFNLDGRKVLATENEIQAFFDKARESSLKEGRTNTPLQATLLPPGNTWEEAQRWLAPLVTGDRAKALFDHASSHGGWLVLVLVARSKGEKHIYEHTLIAVTNGESEDKARVIGFMD